MDVENFPRQFARTRRFSLGVPRRFTVPRPTGGSSHTSPGGALRVVSTDGRGDDRLLPGASHLVTQEGVADSLLLLELDFRKKSLGA
ncbi:hypothetical protein [Streptomyces spiramyceticus]|uniref:hypothetical protein n=1 Tax=Streptomyces spiramyceticus TaxID=299717 RepID=UPI00237BBCEC|nr:hypothetical protein [Streptomyces spiramyceticus]